VPTTDAGPVDDTRSSNPGPGRGTEAEAGGVAPIMWRFCHLERRPRVAKMGASGRLRSVTEPDDGSAAAREVRDGNGFIAALDQSGGSTPKALRLYGVGEEQYADEDEMFDRIHEMRSRIITSPSFGGDRVVGAILFEMTMDRQIDGQDSGHYLW
jgi:hypothetical protein